MKLFIIDGGEITMLRQSLIRIILAVTVAWGVAMAVIPARAGGGPALSARQLLRLAAVSSALEGSTHIAGSTRLEETAAVKGIAISIAGGVRFSGDTSWGRSCVPCQGQRGRRHPQLKLKGRYRVLNQSRSFVVKASHLGSAYKLGASGLWSCLPLTADSGSISSNSLGGSSMIRPLLFGRWLRHISRRAEISSLGSAVLYGLPVWDVQVNLHTRVDLASLLAIQRSMTTRRAIRDIHSVVGQFLQALTRFPHPWVTVKVNVWISQLRYTISRVRLTFKVRARGHIFFIHALVNFSRYGEHVAIRLPARCSS